MPPIPAESSLPDVVLDKFRRWPMWSKQDQQNRLSESWFMALNLSFTVRGNVLGGETDFSAWARGFHVESMESSFIKQVAWGYIHLDTGQNFWHLKPLGRHTKYFLLSFTSYCNIETIQQLFIFQIYKLLKRNSYLSSFKKKSLSCTDLLSDNEFFFSLSSLPCLGEEYLMFLWIEGLKLNWE